MIPEQSKLTHCTFGVKYNRRTTSPTCTMSHDYYTSECLLSMDYIPVECAALGFVVFLLIHLFTHSFITTDNIHTMNKYNMHKN